MEVVDGVANERADALGKSLRETRGRWQKQECQLRKSFHPTIRYVSFDRVPPATYLVASELSLNIDVKVRPALFYACHFGAEGSLKAGEIVDEGANANAGAAGLRGVGRTNALLCGAETAAALLELLETVDGLVEVKDEVCAV